MTIPPRPPGTVRVAAVQMVSTPRVDANLATAAQLITEATAAGAQLVALPEYFCLMGMQDADKVAVREPLGRGPIQDFLAAQARQHGIWLVGGTLPLEAPEAERVLNSTLVFDPRGERVARYDKVHLFRFTRGAESYDEAVTIAPGRDVSTFLFRSAGRSGSEGGTLDLLRPALPGALSRDEPARPDPGSGGLHGNDRPRALGDAAAGACDREPLLCTRAGARWAP